MTEDRKNRFEKAPRKVLAVLWGVLALALCVGLFFVGKAVRDDLKRGVERYILMREPRVSSDIPQTPAKALVALADGLESRRYPFRIDADGYIMPSIVHHQANLTIVFLGGSTTECMYMQEEERFPYLTGRLLESSLGLKVNTLNGGNAGNNTVHALLLLQGKVLPRHPQAVVFMECINDLNVLMQLGGYWTPHANRGVVHYKEYNSIRTFLFKHFGGLPSLPAGGQDEFEAQRDQRSVPDFTELTKAYRKNLETFVFLCREYNIIPVLMTQFNRFGEHPEDNLLKQMQPLLKGFNIDYSIYRAAYETFQNTLRQVAVEQKVALIDLDRLVPKDKSMMYDTVHLKPAGARRVAEILAQRLPGIIGAKQHDSLKGAGALQ